MVSTLHATWNGPFSTPETYFKHSSHQSSPSRFCFQVTCTETVWLVWTRLNIHVFYMAAVTFNVSFQNTRVPEIMAANRKPLHLGPCAASDWLHPGASEFYSKQGPGILSLSSLWSNHVGLIQPPWWIQKDFPQEINRPEPEADYSLPSSAELYLQTALHT
jgi:hypothetical protein